MVKRRQPDNDESEDYVNCIYCKALVLKRHLLKHCKTCKGCDNKKEKKRNLIQKGIVMQFVSLGKIGEELGSILETLSNDAVTYAIMNDSLLLTYGQMLINLQLEKELYR